MLKNLPAMHETRFHPWVRKIPWRREWQPTPVFLPGEFPIQRSLAGYSPWYHKELNMTERLTHTHTRTHRLAFRGQRDEQLGRTHRG